MTPKKPTARKDGSPLFKSSVKVVVLVQDGPNVTTAEITLTLWRADSQAAELKKDAIFALLNVKRDASPDHPEYGISFSPTMGKGCMYYVPEKTPMHGQISNYLTKYAAPEPVFVLPSFMVISNSINTSATSTSTKITGSGKA
jgi:hypothetical protein